MALILSIDTSTKLGSIAIARDGIPVEKMLNNQQRDHAAWVHPAINNLLSGLSISIKELDAIAVSGGPGSYTGLRVALATAKGLCFVLNIPLIIENSLKIIASGLLKDQVAGPGQLICPMIDARRMEVFTAIYTADLGEISSPQSLILQEDSFGDFLSTQKIVFSGDGAGKFEKIVRSPNAVFPNRDADAADLSPLAEERFQRQEFDDLTYSSPVYVKSFHDTRKS